VTVSTFTPGKLILLGEYAVLEGAPALVTAINKFAKIVLKETADNQFYLSAPNLNLIDLPFQVENNQSIDIIQNLTNSQLNRLTLFKKVILHIYKHFQKQENFLRPCHITIDTGDFYFENTKHKLGLGSSAALTVGLIESFYKFNNIEFENSHELFRLTLQTHFEAQGKIGSGIDIAASAFGGVGIYKKLKKEYSYEPITLPENLYMIPIWTGSSTSTPQFVSKTNQLKSNNSNEYNRIINRLSNQSTQGCEYLLKNDSNSFFDVVDKFYESLNELGNSAGISIISESHKKIKGFVKDCKGFYKPSGAGGSDIGIAFTNDLTVKNNIIKKIKKSQFKYIKLETTEIK